MTPREGDHEGRPTKNPVRSQFGLKPTASRECAPDGRYLPTRLVVHPIQINKSWLVVLLSGGLRLPPSLSELRRTSRLQRALRTVNQDARRRRNVWRLGGQFHEADRFALSFLIL